MSEKLPWFKFYASDWISDARVRAMTSRQKGWYIDLMAYAWQEGGLPDDPKVLMVLTSYPADAYGYAQNPPLAQKLEQEFHAVVEMFRTILPDERRTHPKLQALRQEMEQVSATKAKAANARWTAYALHKDKHPHSIRNTSQNQITESSELERATSTEGVLNRAAAAAAAPASPQANGADPIQAAFNELIQEGRQLPARYLTNPFGKEERNPASERLDAEIQRALPRIRQARMPVAFAKKVILDALKGA